MIEKFLIFVAPFLVVTLSVGFLFWLGARKPRSERPQ